MDWSSTDDVEQPAKKIQRGMQQKILMLEAIIVGILVSSFSKSEGDVLLRRLRN
jgi:hypothetical protein